MTEMFWWMEEFLPYILMGMTVLLLALMTLVIILFVKNGKINKKYQIFMSGEDGKSLEKEIMHRFLQIDALTEGQDMLAKHMKEIDETLLLTYQKVGVVKYDAFQEMGGKLSFTLAMLNDENDGFIINSMHSSREGCYTYIKEIIKGESFVILSEEEKQALQRALDTKNFMG